MKEENLFGLKDEQLLNWLMVYNVIGFWSVAVTFLIMMGYIK